MRNPPVIDFKIIDIENEENRLFTLSESDTEIDSCEEDSIQPDDSGEIISRGRAFISHEQEILDEILDDTILKIETKSSIEKDIIENLKEGFQAIDDIISEASQFVEQAITAEVKTFSGLVYTLYENAKASVTKTVTIVEKLKEKKFLSLVPLAEDVTTEVDQIKVLVSKTNLELIKESLEDQKTIITRRKINTFPI